MEATPKSTKSFSDLALAAYLTHVPGVVLVRVVRVGHLGHFVFEGEPLEEEVPKFYTGRSLVDPVKYYATLKHLKAMSRSAAEGEAR